MQANNLGEALSKSDFAYETLVAMGISTGGPKLLNQLVSQLDAKVSASYVIVQHMPPGFTKNLAQRLDTLTELSVKEAEDGECLQKGYVYIAPGGMQLKLINGKKPQFQLTDEPPYKSHRPSVNLMLLSIAEMKQLSKRLIAVIMTGMGNDGLEGVTAIKAKHPCTVIAQDQASSTVFGMPKAIISAGLADYIVSGERIAHKIKEIAGDSYGR